MFSLPGAIEWLVILVLTVVIAGAVVFAVVRRHDPERGDD